MKAKLSKVKNVIFKTKKHTLAFVLSVLVVFGGTIGAYAALSQTPDLQIAITDRDGSSHTIMSWYYDNETGQYYDENGKSLSELGLIDSSCSDSKPYYYSGVWKTNNSSVAYATATSAVKVSDLLSYCQKADSTALEILSTNSSSVELRIKGSEVNGTTSTAWDLYGGLDQWSEKRYYNKDSIYNAEAGIEVPTVLALKSAFDKNGETVPDASKADRSSGIRLLQGQNAKVTSTSTAKQYANMWINQGNAPEDKNEGSLPNVAKIEITPTYYPVRVANGTTQGDEGEEGYSSKVVGATVTPDDHYFSSLSDLDYGFNVTIDNSYELHSVYFNGEKLEADSVVDNIYHFSAKTQSLDKGNKIVVNTRRSEGSPQGTLYLEDVEGGTLGVKSGGASLTNGSAVEEGMVLELSFTPKTGYEFNNFTVKGQDWIDDTNTYTVTAQDCALTGGLHVGAKTTAKKAKVILTSRGLQQTINPGMGGWNRKNQDYYGEITATYKDPQTGQDVAIESGDMVSVGAEIKMTISAPNGYTPMNFWKVSTSASGSVSCAYGPSLSNYVHSNMDKTRTATYTPTAQDSELASIEFVAYYQLANTKLNACSDSSMGELAIYRNSDKGTDQYPVISNKITYSIGINVNLQLIATPKAGYKVDHFYYYSRAYSELDEAGETHILDADLYTQSKYQASLYVDGDFIEENGHYLYIGVEWAQDNDRVEVSTNARDHIDFVTTIGGIHPSDYSKIIPASELRFDAVCDAGFALDSVTIKEYRKVSATSDSLQEASYSCKPIETFKLKTNTVKVEVTPVVISAKAVTLSVPSTSDAHKCGFDYVLTYNAVIYQSSIQKYSDDVVTVFDTSKDDVGSSVKVYQGSQLHLKATPIANSEPDDNTQQYLDSFTYLFMDSLNSKYGTNSAVVTGSEQDFKATITHDTEDITWDRATDTSWYSADKSKFEISTAAQLAGLSVLVNKGESFEGKVVYLTSDIDTYGDSSIAIARFFPSIGTQENPFKGTFDGLSHYVKLYESTAHSSLGVFGYCENATIQNLTVKGAINRFYSEIASMGAVVGTMTNGTVSRCTNEANIKASTIQTGNRYYVGCGGVVGCASGDKVNIENCQNRGNLEISLGYGGSTAWYAYAGGILGMSKDLNTLDLEGCVNYGASKASSSVRNGAILGLAYFSTQEQEAKVCNCYNLGEISYGSSVSEIVASIKIANKSDDNFTCGKLLINSCYSAGSTKSYSGADGVGSFLGKIESNYSSSVEKKTGLTNIEIKNSYYRADNSRQYASGTGEETTVYEITALGESVYNFNDYQNWTIPSKTEAVVTLDALKDYASKLGTAFCKDTYGLNVSYGSTPILIWQAPGTSAIFIRDSVNGVVTSALTTADAGTKVYLDVEADDGYKLSALEVKDVNEKSIDVAVEAEDTRYSFIMPDSLAMVSAEFAKLYSVSLGEDIENGSLEPDATKAIAGQKVTVSVKPKQYCVLDTIECVSADAQDIELTTIEDGIKYSFIMPQNDVTLAATFEKEFSVIVKSAENGSISVNRTGAREGNTICITPVPDAGYVLDSLKIVDMQNNKYTAQKQEDGTYTFDMPGASVQITPSFVKVQTKPVVNISVGKAKLKSAKSKVKGKLALKWKKLVGISGYQIYYKCKGGAAKYKKASASSKAKVLKKLKRGKKYKVKLRAFKVYEGKTYWGKWSNSKSVKIKKK